MFLHDVFRQCQLNKCIFSHNLCKKLSMISIFVQHFWHLSQFCPVSSSFVRKKLEEIGFFHFFPGVLEEIGFFRKKPNPAFDLDLCVDVTLVLGVNSPTTFKLQHIHYTHTYEPPERLPPESQIYSSTGGRPVHIWPRNGKMDIQCLKTERIAHGYMECYNEWTDISRWTHSRMASVPFWLWTMDWW